jgi:hypothetical protein
MDPNMMVACEFALVFGVPLAWAARELWLLRHDTSRRPPEAVAEPEPAPLPDPGLVVAVQKPLPESLIPKPVRVRELA